MIGGFEALSRKCSKKWVFVYKMGVLGYFIAFWKICATPLFCLSFFLKN